jgi:DNA-binding response OmpR family regulator
MPTVLLVEDDPVIYEAIRPYAEREQKALVWARSVDEAEELLAESQPEVVLVDRGLPGRSGDELARQLSASAIPFIMLTARARERDRLAGFDLGADDYVVKPFSAPELMKRIAVVLRRRGVRRIVLASQTELDRDARGVRVRGQIVPLTRTEFALIERLALWPDRAFTRTELVELLELDPESSERALDSHVKNIRRKFRRVGIDELIETVVGIGYALMRGL